MRDLDGKGYRKLDMDPAMLSLDAGVLAIRDMLIAEGATYFETCAGSRVLDCRGCMSGASRFDGAILAARKAANRQAGTKIFADKGPGEVPETWDEDEPAVPVKG